MCVHRLRGTVKHVPALPDINTLASDAAIPSFLGIDWLDPEWLLDRFGSEFLWISLLILFIECGLFFPFLPGDALLFAYGIFVATERIARSEERRVGNKGVRMCRSRWTGYH